MFRIVICGFRRVGQPFVQLMTNKEVDLRQEHGLKTEVRGVVGIGVPPSHGKAFARRPPGIKRIPMQRGGENHP